MEVLNSTVSALHLSIFCWQQLSRPSQPFCSQQIFSQPDTNVINTTELVNIAVVEEPTYVAPTAGTLANIRWSQRCWLQLLSTQTTWDRRICPTTRKEPTRSNGSLLLQRRCSTQWRTNRVRSIVSMSISHANIGKWLCPQHRVPPSRRSCTKPASYMLSPTMATHGSWRRGAPTGANRNSGWETEWSVSSTEDISAANSN